MEEEMPSTSIMETDPDDQSRAEEEDSLEETLTEELIRHWTNERFAPEVLPHQEDLLERALSRIHQQSMALDVLANNPEDLSSDDHFRLMLIETEIEHMRYICKAYARCRMYKLDKYFDHCLMDPETRSRLSKVDLEYCAREQTLVHNLLFDSVLDQLPTKYRKLDEDHMIIRPDLDQGIFIVVRADCGPVTLPNSGSTMLEKGSKHFIRYRCIRSFLQTGQKLTFLKAQRIFDLSNFRLLNETLAELIFDGTISSLQPETLRHQLNLDPDAAIKE